MEGEAGFSQWLLVETEAADVQYELGSLLASDARNTQQADCQLVHRESPILHMYQRLILFLRVRI